MRLEPLLFTAGLALAAAPAPAAPPPLPLTEVPARHDAGADAPFMILMTGDGGWAEFVRTIAERLAAEGWDVVGFDMRKYLWTPRTPEETAAAIGAVIHRYDEKWQRRRIVIAGFSRGADLAPFVVNRLPPDLRERVALVVLLSPGKQAEFEFHLGDFVRKPRPEAQKPVAEEVDRLGTQPLLMLYGNKDDEAIDVPLHMPPGRAVRLPGDHHLNRDYDTIVKLIRAAASPKAASTGAASGK
jgi:type IV secretory pathway VirJ component